MEIALLITSFLAGVLTVLAPCVLPLLPIIIGSSIEGKNKSGPYIITASLAVFITVFTILLKASTLLLDIDPLVWKYISGGLIFVFGLTYLFPEAWSKLLILLKISGKSDQLLEKASEKQGILKSVLIGASLSPVFASCSPTYSLILATVLPVNFWVGIIYIFAYALGLASIMLAIAVLGRGFIKKINVFANPNGWFKKALGILFIIVSLSIMTGFDKKVETAILDKGFFDVTTIDQQLIEKNLNTDSPFQNTETTTEKTSNSLFNTSAKTPAPEIAGIQNWINSDPQTLTELKGKVVLVDFWTYSCINCQRTLPYLTKWYDTYKDQGFVILGIHAPEFSFEKNPSNVEKFVKENNIHYPVGLDNDFKTWNAYNNQFWPAEYLIDKEGNVRRTHFGEGKYDETEMAIRELLKEKGSTVSNELTSTQINADKPQGQYCDPNTKECVRTTPETYLGYSRSENFANEKEAKTDQDTQFKLASSLQTNQWTLGGTWNIGPEEITSKANTNTFRLKFNAQKVYIVISGNGVAEVKVNGEIRNLGANVTKEGKLDLNGSQLYNVVSGSNYLQNGEVEITVPAGISLNVVTFG
jgi:cytochrome c biogenesis protein CcdA/thiol-disulfide isomerase/thioredoxin